MRYFDDVQRQAYRWRFDPSRLSELGRWEARLDHKFERILAILLKLKKLKASDSIIDDR